MKKILIIILISLGLACCTSNEYHDIPNDKKPLINNGTFYYKDSATSKIDTFIVKRNDYEQTHLGGDANYYYATIFIEYKKNTKYNNYFTYQITTFTAVGLSFGIACYDVSYDFNRNNTISYPIQGITYPLVYVADVLNKPDTIPNKVYFTCQNGIIRYEYKDGRVYNLLSK